MKYIPKFQQPVKGITAKPRLTRGKTNEQIYNTFSPAGGFGFFGKLGAIRDANTRSGNQPRQGSGNAATPDEESYWKGYLGLSNNLPAMNPQARTEWDQKIEQAKKVKSTFVGTSPKMDQLIQSIADTTNTGKVVRNYDAYKKSTSNIPDKDTFEKVYEFGKKVLQNPNQWQKGNEDLSLKHIPSTNKYAGGTGLGMLQRFGMKWNPVTRTASVHDTYDFPWWTKGNIPTRESKLKIRGQVQVPKEGSYLLRNNLLNYNK